MPLPNMSVPTKHSVFVVSFLGLPTVSAFICPLFFFHNLFVCIFGSSCTVPSKVDFSTYDYYFSLIIQQIVKGWYDEPRV